ncbi:hypothetical protein V5O48_000557 [Marasmius crinis-equi]|uniref:Cytochrome P450 n=1 Tax=Marasmius crinis-equi TaxID=585013 RepID=A0ABR3G1I3_9AGAR
MSSPTILFLLVAVSLLIYFKYNRPRRVGLNYPPGPRKLPFVGNLLQLPKERQWIKFREWATEYGPIFHLEAGPDHIVVLNTPEATEDLLVKRNRIFTDRMSPHVAADIVSAGQRMLFLPGASTAYKSMRKALAAELGPAPSKHYRRHQDLESRVFLYDFLRHGNKTDMLMKGKSRDKDALHDPDYVEQHWFSLVRRFSTSVVLMVMYGERVHKIKDNKTLYDLYEVVDNITHIAVPGAFMADVFTCMQKLPNILAPWRLKAQKMHERELDLYGGFLTKIRADQRAGINRPECFVGKYLKARDIAVPNELATSGRGITPNGWLRDMLLAYSAGTILEAGSDTTTSAIISFFLFMLWHPEVMQKAREEIDRVVGPDRLPTFEDEEKLPYIVAIVKEVIRCRPPTPLGIPHRSIEDTVYNGYLIPKGSLVFGNVWALHLDPARFHSPTEFIPDRWLSGSDEKDFSIRWGGSGPKQTRDHYVFGWGRRFCLGMHIAEASLFIAVARIIWGLDIHAPADPLTGKSLLLDPWDEENYTAGFVTNAVPFNVTFKPRSMRHMEVLQHAFEDAQDQWEILGLSKDER